jgi:hypothetical protein
MAIMVPRPLSDDIREDYLRTAECKVYDRLNDVLDESFTVFYSRPWLGLEKDGAEIDGECDFVIAHPDLGILVIEVKGGGISYDAEKNQWYTVNRDNYEKKIKDPVKQARSGKYRILEKLKTTKHHIPDWIAASYAVIFPDTKKPEFDLGIDKPKEIFCFKPEFNGDFKAWIISRFDQSRKKQNVLGRSGINALHDILAKPFQLHAPLDSFLSEDEKSINLLTQEQYQTLSEIEEIDKVIIKGGAGTGKTVLAMEEAVRRAAQGDRVLLTCFNRPLGVYLSEKLQSVQNVTVRTFHSLCAEIIEKAGLSVPETVSEQEKFQEIYPKLFRNGLEILKTVRFDIIIIDEGQDFRPAWIAALNAALDPKGKNMVRVFYDSNQKIYAESSGWSRGFKLSPIKLTRNLRNTRRIHKLVSTFYRGYLIEAIGPLGQEVRYISADSETAKKDNIVAEVSNLIRNENAKPADITILTDSKGLLNQIAPKGKIGSFPCQNCETFRDDAIIVDTIRRFKGLENKIVIVILSDQMFIEEELLYIAFSRPRTQLIIIGTSSLQTLLQEKCGTKK